MPIVPVQPVATQGEQLVEMDMWAEATWTSKIHAVNRGRPSGSAVPWPDSWKTAVYWLVRLLVATKKNRKKGACELGGIMRITYRKHGEES